LISFILAFIISFLLSFMFSKIASKIGLMDKPRGIKDHSKPTPYGGGVAIFLGTLMCAFFGGECRILVFGFLIFLLGFSSVFKISETFLSVSDSCIYHLVRNKNENRRITGIP
jgi:UDP-N-acetylmuramyl pentapeptide phosphotransferase/UDP-N-acetylglucosamine-1-phosphate transferase